MIHAESACLGAMAKKVSAVDGCACIMTDKACTPDNHFVLVIKTVEEDDAEEDDDAENQPEEIPDEECKVIDGWRTSYRKEFPESKRMKDIRKRVWVKKKYAAAFGGRRDGNQAFANQNKLGRGKKENAKHTTTMFAELRAAAKQAKLM